MTHHKNGAGRWHRCLAHPQCSKVVKYQVWACKRHRAILREATGSDELHDLLAYRWMDRIAHPDEYFSAQRRAQLILQALEFKAT